MKLNIPSDSDIAYDLTQNPRAVPLEEGLTATTIQMLHEIDAALTLTGEMVVTSDSYDNLIVTLPEDAECPAADLRIDENGWVGTNEPRAMMFRSFEALLTILRDVRDAELADTAIGPNDLRNV